MGHAFPYTLVCVVLVEVFEDAARCRSSLFSERCHVLSAVCRQDGERALKSQSFQQSLVKEYALNHTGSLIEI